MPLNDPVLGPVLAVSTGKVPLVLTITLIVSKDDDIDIFEHTITLVDDGDEPGPLPNPKPNPKPDPKPLVNIPPYPDGLKEVITAAYASAVTNIEVKTDKDLEIATTNFVLSQIGTQRFLNEYVPWRTKFDKLRPTNATLEQLKTLWKEVR